VDRQTDRQTDMAKDQQKVVFSERLLPSNGKETAEDDDDQTDNDGLTVAPLHCCFQQ